MSSAHAVVTAGQPSPVPSIIITALHESLQSLSVISSQLEGVTFQAAAIVRVLFQRGPLTTAPYSGEMRPLCAMIPAQRLDWTDRCMGRVLTATAVDIHRVSCDHRMSAVLTPLEISPTITTYEPASSRLIQSELFIRYRAMSIQVPLYSLYNNYVSLTQLMKTSNRSRLNIFKLV